MLSLLRAAEEATARRDVALRDVLALRAVFEVRAVLDLPAAADGRVELLWLAALEFDAFTRLLDALTRLVRFEAVVPFFATGFGVEELFTKRTGFFARDAVVEEGFRFFDEAILKCRCQMLKREKL